MRVKITFSLQKNKVLPINYNYYLASLIYSLLRKSSFEFSSFLHQRGFELDGKHFKLFTFSQLLFKKKRVERDKIVNLGEHIEWFVSSPADEFIQHFVNGLFAGQEIKLSDEKLTPERVETMPLPEFGRNNAFSCLSPITMSTRLERNNKLTMYYFKLNENGFKEKIKQNLIRKYKLLYKRNPQGADLEMEFDEDYIRRGQGISRLINFKGINIRGYTAPFTASGNPELIKVGYECGFGDKNSLGFGMVKAV